MLKILHVTLTCFVFVTRHFTCSLLSTGIGIILILFGCNCSCQPDIMQLIKDLDLSVHPQYTTGTKLMQLTDGSRVSRYNSEIPSLPLFALIDLHLLLRKVDYWLHLSVACHCDMILKCNSFLEMLLSTRKERNIVLF